MSFRQHINCEKFGEKGPSGRGEWVPLAESSLLVGEHRNSAQLLGPGKHTKGTKLL